MTIGATVLLANVALKLSPVSTAKKFEGMMDEKRDTSDDFFVRLFKSSNAQKALVEEHYVSGNEESFFRNQSEAQGKNPEGTTEPDEERKSEEKAHNHIFRSKEKQVQEPLLRD